MMQKMNLNKVTKSEITKLIYAKQRKKTLNKRQIRRCLDLLLKVANDLANESDIKAK